MAKVNFVFIYFHILSLIFFINPKSNLEMFRIKLGKTKYSFCDPSYPIHFPNLVSIWYDLGYEFAAYILFDL